MLSRPSLSDLIKCALVHVLSDPDRVQKSIEFLKNTPEDKLWELCETRVKETRKRILEIVIKENLPLISPEGSNHFYFHPYKPAMRCDRIAIGMAPDSFVSVHMETCLLRKHTLEFLDDYGYEKQMTKEWKTFDDLMDEIRRLVKIYQNTPTNYFSISTEEREYLELCEILFNEEKRLHYQIIEKITKHTNFARQKEMVLQVVEEEGLSDMEIATIIYLTSRGRARFHGSEYLFSDKDWQRHSRCIDNSIKKDKKFEDDYFDGCCFGFSDII